MVYLRPKQKYLQIGISLFAMMKNVINRNAVKMLTTNVGLRSSIDSFIDFQNNIFCPFQFAGALNKQF